jgi:hypothetical protein
MMVKPSTFLTEKEGTVVKDFIPILLDKAGNFVGLVAKG